jgi:hypothetical protein
LKDHHADSFGEIGRFQSQHLVQISDRQKISAASIDWRTVNILNVLSGGVALDADEFKKTHLRDNESFATARNNQSRNDCQRERNSDLDRGTFAEPAEDIDNTTNLFDVGFNHIHSNSSSRDIRYCLGRRESRLEYKAEHLPVTQLTRSFRP